MLKSRKYVVKRHFEGLPKREDFEIIEHDLPPLEDGQILVKSEWISVDPYMRVFNSILPVPCDQYGYQVGVVQKSKHAEYPIGTRVVTHNGWCDYSVTKVDAIVPFHVTPSLKGKDSLCFFYKLPDLRGLSPSLAIGAIGMPGATAYFGMLETCNPQPGETVVVTSAAGAVGSLAGQIAKIKGCKVIGFAGSDEKVKWLENDLGFDKAFNYKTVDAQKVLKEAAPEGIDCYFDNVGGELSSVIMYQMNPFGRIAVSGCISAYNDDLDNLPKATIVQHAIVVKTLKLEGVHVFSKVEHWPAAFKDIVEWIISGKIKVREHITEGFDKLYDAFISMLAGENIGKAVIKI